MRKRKTPQHRRRARASSKVLYDVLRVSMGQKRHESGPHVWTVAWRKAAALNKAARKAFAEGRIMYDVPEYIVEKKAS
jgi:hypothetical protein